MKAFSNDNLKYGMGDAAYYDGINVNIAYSVNVESRTVTFTDTSTFKNDGDDLDKVLCHAYAKDGTEVHGEITASTVGGAATVTFPTGTDLSSLNLTATIISVQGYKYDLGVYGIGVVNGLTGKLGNESPQGKRGTVSQPTT